MVRTISMLPAATEIVGALDLMDDLLAVSHECDYPEQANRLPRITNCPIYGRGLPAAEVDRWVADQLATKGSLYIIDETMLRELRPELILTQRLCDVCAPAFDSVQALAAQLPTSPYVLNLEPSSLSDVFGCITDVARAMGEPARAEPVCDQLRSRVAEVESRVERQPTPTVFVMEWADPIYNSGHWIPELVRRAGGIPLLSPEGQPSVRTPWEFVRAADPEMLILASCGQTVEQTKRDLPALTAQPGWSTLRAVRANHVYLADGAAYFSRPGPRLVDTLEMLAWMLHPEACREAYPRRGIVEFLDLDLQPPDLTS